jgi:hypothetical protein
MTVDERERDADAGLRDARRRARGDAPSSWRRRTRATIATSSPSSDAERAVTTSRRSLFRHNESADVKDIFRS